MSHWWNSTLTSAYSACRVSCLCGDTPLEGKPFFILFIFFVYITVGKQLFSHFCSFVCVFRERRPTFVWRWTVLAALAMVALALVAAVEAGATAAHAASPHITAEGLHFIHPDVPARDLALRTHLTLIKQPASSTWQCISWVEKTDFTAQILNSLHGPFDVLVVCCFSCCMFLFFVVVFFYFTSHFSRFLFDQLR